MLYNIKFSTNKLNLNYILVYYFNNNLRPLNKLPIIY